MIRIVAIFAFVLSGTVRAEGLLTSQADVFDWMDDIESDYPSLDYSSFNINSDEWYQESLRTSGQLMRTDTLMVGQGLSNPVDADVKRRVISPTSNSSVALGFGWEEINLGRGEDAAAPKLLLEGRLGVAGWAYVYGQTAWLPDFGDSSTRGSLSGYELEAGLSLEPLPFWSVRAGYRHFRFDYTGQSGFDSGSSVSGFLLGTGLHW